MAGYAPPEMVVETRWVAKHGRDGGIRLVEVDVDTSAHDHGHIEGAVSWDWKTQLCDTIRGNAVPNDAFERLMAGSGIGDDTTVVLYGDDNNSFATWALWQMRMHGHKHVRLMNGGRKKWISERRELIAEVSVPAKEAYRVIERDTSLRALQLDVRRALKTNSHRIVDVRSREEFTGKIHLRPGLSEACQSGGHIPAATNVPWELTCNDDGSFKSADELVALYWSRGITSDKPTIVYSRIGMRSCHTWFVLKYLLGYKGVTNYDGSWTKWGNLLRPAIERGRGEGMVAADIASVDAALVRGWNSAAMPARQSPTANPHAVRAQLRSVDVGVVRGTRHKPMREKSLGLAARRCTARKATRGGYLL